jgi:hypothetical protein
MNKKDIVIGFAILAVLVLVVYLLRRPSSNVVTLLPSPTPSSEEKIESSFKIDIPEDVDKTELKDVSNTNAIGIATKKFENGRFSATILADLPEPQSGSYYQAWVTSGDLQKGDTKFTTLGTLRIAKGGWMVEFQSNSDLSENKNVLISLETTADSRPEKHIMEGSFKE